MYHKSYFLGVKELPYLPSVGWTKEYMYSYGRDFRYEPKIVQLCKEKIHINPIKLYTYICLRLKGIIKLRMNTDLR